MPWDVRRRGNRFVVVNPDGRVMGTHGSEAKARAQQRALYANVPESRGSSLTRAAKRRRR